jgi:methylthioribose-1-phosphate isomerase
LLKWLLSGCKKQREQRRELSARVIAEAWRRKGTAGRVYILTHCNAGWLAAVDWGTALAPVYRAHDDGIPIYVWVRQRAIWRA